MKGENQLEKDSDTDFNSYKYDRDIHIIFVNTIMQLN